MAGTTSKVLGALALATGSFTLAPVALLSFVALEAAKIGEG